MNTNHLDTYDTLTLTILNSCSMPLTIIARSYSILTVLSRCCSTLAIIRHHPSVIFSSFVRLCRLKNLRSAVM
jgi:hypothetical protein